MNDSTSLSPLLRQFEYHSRTRLVFGVGASNRVGELAKELGGRRAFVVTDPGIVAAGLLDPTVKSLEIAGLTATVFDQVHENPTTRDVDVCLAAAKKADIDSIVGLGGGSSMDAAKGCNFLLTNGGEMKDYWGVGKATKPMLPLIAIPTTAGTGSECQSYALISDEVTHVKMACGDPKAAPRVSILDPSLTLTQPTEVAACTGIDAISHAVETAVTTKRNPLSLLYSREAFRLLANNFPRIFESPGDLEARAAMQLGAAFAGTAIENSMLGAAHAAANPLTARYGITHGKAVGVMLPSVVRFNANDAAVAEEYRLLFPEGVEALATRLEEFLRIAGLPSSLSELGVKESDDDSLAEEAEQQWTGTFNPVPVKREDFVALYKAAF